MNTFSHAAIKRLIRHIHPDDMALFPVLTAGLALIVAKQASRAGMSREDKAVRRFHLHRQLGLR
jgi:hypothetical protein